VLQEEEEEEEEVHVSRIGQMSNANKMLVLKPDGMRLFLLN
jgi:hypothetical protein